MAKHLVLIGGGHAHMVTLANLDQFSEKGHRVTVIQPSAYHYYSGMGPGMLGKTYTPDDIRFATQHVVEKKGGQFILGKAVRVEPDNKRVHLESGETVAYDVLSANAGSYVPLSRVEGDARDIFTVKPIEKLLEAQERIVRLVKEKPTIIAIVGGGPSAAEIAGNISQLVHQTNAHSPAITIFAGKRFMSRFPENVRAKVKKALTKRSIEIQESGYVKKIETGRVVLESDAAYSADLIFIALGVKPSPLFESSNLPTGPDGGLKVNAYLQCIDYPEIFGGGDCIYFADQPLDKVGVYAVRQNPILFHNLMASLEQTDLMPFHPGGDYLLIFNTGHGAGVFKKKGVLFGGRLAFVIKDYIDRKFMKKFQSIE